MPKKDNTYRTIKTIEGTIIHLYEDDKGITKPHSAVGPAILYSKEQNKPDEYYIYGIKYEYDKWLELSRPLRKVETTEDLQDS
jgi:hypothetical protein